MRNAPARFAGLACASAKTMVAVAGLVSVTACSGVLDVDNPNNVVENSLDNSTAASAIATGVAASVTRGLTAIYAPYGAATDEFAWVGSREGYKIADDGNLADQTNEFVDASFPYVAEARFVADDAIARLEKFDTDKTLANRADLARTYLYAAIIYTTIPDAFDDFVISSKKIDNGDPVGETAMNTLYDKAITFLDKGLVIANAINNAALRSNLTGMRARTRYAKAAWAKVNPVGQVNTASPLVNDAGADADAAAALALMGTGDYRFAMTPAVGGNSGFPIVGNDLNNRLELRAGDYSRDLALCRDAACDRFAIPAAAGNTVTGIKYQDPVTKIIDPVLDAAVRLCCIKGTQNTNGDYVPLTQVSARDMYLIRAEVALAQGNTTGFRTYINQLRALNATLTPYDGVTPAPIEMLKHSRFVNLYNQARRLNDMYRFSIRSDRWASTGDAVRKPGCFFPIPAIERTSNEKVTAAPLCRA